MTPLIVLVAMASLWVEGDQREVYPVIHGGYQIPVEDAPFIAAYTSEIFRCGACIISNKHVLSAAHCYNETAKMHRVIVGSDNLAYNGETYDVKQIKVHPHYDGDRNDVLVIQLAKSLKFSSRVQPITLAERNLKIPNGAMLDVMGYGETLEDKENKNLYKTSVPYVDLETCKFLAHNEISNDMLCTGNRGNKHHAKGDSGGPLVYGKTLVGLVSFVFKERHNIPVSVYARVSALRDFIDSAMETLN